MNPLLAPGAAEVEESTLTTASDVRSISATYHVGATSADVEKVCQALALEQTVEVPAAMAEADPRVRRLVGRIESITPLPRQRNQFACQIAYESQLSGGHLPQLLNLLYGNISLQRNITLTDFTLPDAVLAGFRGPRYGVAGLRKMLGVNGRPLLATALKPVGISSSELADLAFQFARGGGDLVKDDHNQHWTDWTSFRERVEQCHAAVERANAMTGRRTLYLPHVCGPAETLEQACELCLELGLRGVLVSPHLLGLDVVRALADKYPLLMMAHPTFGGAYCVDPQHGVDTGVLLGKLWRLIGADISIFPNHGGRFPITQADCESIQANLQQPWGALAQGWPAPAGGMQWDSLPRMAEAFGADAVFLIGGALLSHSANLERSTRELITRLDELFPTQMVAPADEFVSACEWPGARGANQNPLHLQSQALGQWVGRSSVAYKQQAELPFQGVARQELINGSDRTAFDLRYFEIEPGGFSSLERHGHTHVVIGVRGVGTVCIEDQRLTLQPHDIAYVPPWSKHQLRNESTEPFGFYCIVDHKRDRPIAP